MATTKGTAVTVTLTEVTYNELLDVITHMRGNPSVTEAVRIILTEAIGNKAYRYERNVIVNKKAKADKQLLAQLLEERKIREERELAAEAEKANKE